VTEVELTPSRIRELADVNEMVNQLIRPEIRSYETLAPDWSINPASGDCNDYAVSKRHELLLRGWPAEALALAVVRTRAGEGHLVLVVHTNYGDLVLDNLVSSIRPWTAADYQWLKRQSAGNPRLWVTVPPATSSSSVHVAAAPLVL
jgi:predicted transglutaminase-like cysteine proteinase